MMHRFSFRLFVAAFALACAPSFAAAQQNEPEMGEAVAAVVNDQPITTYDVRQRVQLMLISRGGQIPPQLLPQLQLQAVRDLIDERVKLLEAEKFNLTVDDDDIERELAQIAAQSGASVEQLTQALAADGVSVDALRAQLRADISWRRLVSGRFRDRVRVSPSEIDQVLNRMRAESLRERYVVSEICLPVSAPEERRQIIEAGRQIADAVRQGAPFERIAQNFSSCPSAATGGDLGVVSPGQLPTEYDAAIRQLNSGEVSQPIEGEGEFRVFLMREKLTASEAGEPTYEVVHLFAPAATGADRARSLLQRAAAGGCESALAQRSGPDAVIDGARLPPMLGREISAAFSRPLEGLRDGDRTGVIEANGVYNLLVVCSVDEGLGLPPRERIEDQLFGRQLELFAQRYLRDIRSSAAIENRLAQTNG